MRARAARGLLPAVVAVAAAALAGCGATGVRVGAGTPSGASQPPPSVTISSVPPVTTRPTLPPAAPTPTTVAGQPGTGTATTTIPTAPTTTAPTTTVPSGAAPSTTVPSASTTTTVPAVGTIPPTTAALGGPAPVCRASQLAADQVPLAAGTGHYFLAWSLTDTSGSACEVPAGHPALELDDAAGQAVVAYQTGTLSGGSTAGVTVAPRRAAWFLTEEVSTGCPSSTTVSGGPFTYKIALPDGAGTVSWQPSYLDGATLSDLCTRVGLEVGGIQATEPAA